MCKSRCVGMLNMKATCLIDSQSRLWEIQESFNIKKFILVWEMRCSKTKNQEGNEVIFGDKDLAENSVINE